MSAPIKKPVDKMVEGLSKITGWSANLTGDILGTMAASAGAYLIVVAFSEVPDVFAAIAASFTSAILWRKLREDS